MDKMPLYQCYKRVRAFKIAEIVEHGDGEATLISDGGSHKIAVGEPYLEKHKPEDGGYYVQYKDGYQSYSPADAFEEGYERIEE